MTRALAFAGACALTAGLSAGAAADTVAITSGSASLYWDGSLAGFTIASPDSEFRSDYHAAAAGGFDGGSTVDLSTTVPVANDGNHPLSVTYRGQQFPQAWVAGALTIAAKPFVAPPADGDGSAAQTFTTTFTMTGTIAAYATRDHTGPPLFQTGVSGGGTISAGPYRIVGNSYVLNSGGEAFIFAPPADPQLPAPWQTTDVGDVGTAGYAYQGSDGDLFAGGAGADIWDTADSFRFVYQAFDGDGDIAAHLGAEQNTSASAKAGVMLRQSLDPGSPDVILDVTPAGNIEFMTRAAAGGTTRFIAGGNVPVAATASSMAMNVYLTLARSGATVTASVCSTACRTIGSTQWLTGPALIGVAVTSHDRTQVNDAYFPAAMPTVHHLPAPWTFLDVGSVGQPGSASASNAVFTVSGAGSDIWGTADAFAAVEQPLQADGTFAARVLDEQNTHVFAKAGIQVGMLNPGSARVILDVKPDGGVEFMARLADGSAMSFLAGSAGSFPMRLQLTRTGDRVDAAVAADGQPWSPVGSVQIALPATVPAALAVTSHDPAVLNTARFDQVSLTAGPPLPSSAPADIVVYASDLPDAALHGSWTRASDLASPQGVKLVTPDAGFMTDALASPLHYIDVPFTASAGTPYTLWLRLQASGNSKFNDSVWVQFSDATANGAAVYPVGTTSALLVNLATDSGAASLDGWGWQHGAYWLSQSTTVDFAASGPHTLRIQVREDGVQLDQIVLSPARFRTSAPGPVGGDATIVPR